MVKLVDAVDSKSTDASHDGSSPSPGTIEDTTLRNKGFILSVLIFDEFDLDSSYWINQKGPSKSK